MSRDLLINEPQLQSLHHKLGDTVLTAAMWGIYLYLWLPLVSLVAWLFGIQLFYHELIEAGGYLELLDKVALYATVIPAIFVVIISWSLSNRRRFRGQERRNEVSEISPAEMTAFFDVTTGEFERLRAASRIVIAIDENGRIEHIDD